MTNDILEQIKAGEVSGVQFKERALDKYDIGCELVAFSNARGGKLVVGVNDKTGQINALSYSEVQETTNLLSDIASENVVPSILINVETVAVEDGSLVVATIKEGVNKPYHDNKGIVWVKNGSDKRKVFDNAELAEMMTDCGSFAPDEASIKGATINDLDANTIKAFLENRFDKVLEKKGLVGDAFNEAALDTICSAIAKGHDCERMLRNLRFIRPDGKLTMAAMLLFGKYTQRWLPVMTAKCICFAGNSVGGKVFRDKVNDADMEGNLLHQFNTIMDFFSRNLHNVQVGEEFNSMGKLEIPYSSLVEITVWREESNQVEGKSNQVEDLDTRLRHLDTDHNTFGVNHDTFISDSDTDHDTFCSDSDTKLRHSDTRRVSLSKKQKDIVNFCSVPRTSREILERAGVVYHTKNIAKYITSLVAAGYLQMTNPENPTASNQKYKKTTIK